MPLTSHGGHPPSLAPSPAGDRLTAGRPSAKPRAGIPPWREGERGRTSVVIRAAAETTTAVGGVVVTVDGAADFGANGTGELVRVLRSVSGPPQGRCQAAEPGRMGSRLPRDEEGCPAPVGRATADDFSHVPGFEFRPQVVPR